MAVTEILLSDPVTTLVTKTNTISSDLGDKAALTTTDKSNLVAALNEINTQLNKVDSADVISLIQANAMDSAEVLALIRADSGETSIMSNFQKDSANGIGFDSSQGRFSIPSNVINTAMIEPDAVDGTKIADDAINSEHYTDGSIDTAHIANDQITEDLMADDAIGSAQLKTLSTLLIKDSAGSTLKTIHGAGA